MFAEETRIRFFVAAVAATAIALACEANDVELASDHEPTDSADTVAWFDSLVFGDKSDAARLRVRFENLLEKKVSAAQRICALSDSERRKLRIAGQGDIERVFERIERARDRVCGSRTDEPSDKPLPADIEQQLCAFGVAVKSDPFRYGSLFDKTLRHDLSFEQLVRYKRWETAKWQVP
jgi:hypothetical protein